MCYQRLSARCHTFCYSRDWSSYDADVLLPVVQVLLNGGNQHIFQSAMRTTAKLNLLSPTVFPLPFGPKLPPLNKGAKAQTAAQPDNDTPAANTAATSKSKVQDAEAEQAKHAQHGQADSNLPDPLLDTVSSAVPQDMPSSKPEQGVGEPRSVSIIGGGRKCKSAARAFRAHGGYNKVGPVVKLVQSSKGLVAAPRNESEMQPQSPGMSQIHELQSLDLKPAIH